MKGIASDILMPYTGRSRANLLREGIAGERIFVIGNPILEVIRHHEDAIGRSGVLARIGLEAQRYLLVTMHREENVDVEVRLRSLVEALRMLSDEHGLPVVVSTRPPHARSDAPLRAGRRQHGRAVHRSLRPAGLHRPPTKRSLRPQRQRNRPGGALHPRRPQRHDPRRDPNVPRRSNAASTS